MCDHLLVGKLVSFGALDDIVKDEDGAVVATLEDQDILIFGLFVVEDLIDLEDHRLARPHVGDFPEPAIFDGRMSDFRHVWSVGSEAGVAFVQGETSEAARGCQWRSTTEPNGRKKTQVGQGQVGRLKRNIIVFTLCTQQRIVVWLKEMAMTAVN
jgi:hypothetical protein